MLSCLLHGANLLKGFCSLRLVDLCVAFWLREQKIQETGISILLSQWRCINGNKSLSILSVSLWIKCTALQGWLGSKFVTMDCQGSFDKLGQLGKFLPHTFSFCILKINEGMRSKVLVACCSDSHGIMVVVFLLYISLLNVRGEMNEGDRNIWSCVKDSGSRKRKLILSPNSAGSVTWSGWFKFSELQFPCL